MRILTLITTSFLLATNSLFSLNLSLIPPSTSSSCLQTNIFAGQSHEESSDFIIIDEQRILESLNTFSIHAPSRRDRAVSVLKEQNFLPLKLNDCRLQQLIKIFGFLLSEGRLSNTKDNRPYIDVYARKEIIDLVQADLLKLNIPSSITLKIEPFRKTKNFYSLVETSTTYRLQIASTPPVILLHALGFPAGNRGEQKLEIPSWLLHEANRWQQQLFLSAYLGCRMAAPTAKTKYHFNGIFIQQSQRTPYADYGVAFQEQLRALLTSFGIESSSVSYFDDYTTPNTTRIRFKIRENDENLIRLFSTLSFEYHPAKQMLANLANHYLQHKKLFIAQNPLIHLTDFPSWEEFLHQSQSQNPIV